MTGDAMGEIGGAVSASEVSTCLFSPDGKTRSFCIRLEIEKLSATIQC